jgi:two-component system, NtrC family, sensor histidine kinase HydH
VPHEAEPRVLIVEDNAPYAENLEEILAGSGYRPRVAGGFAAALSSAAAGFELALVDLRLPDGDGTELASRLKDLNPEAEIVVLTGNATVETAAAAVRAGAFAYLVKPCATEVLLLTLEQAMRQVRLHSEKRELARRAQISEKLAAVGTLTAGLSHEIRNPLNAAGLQLEILERRVRKLDAALGDPLLGPLRLVRDEVRRLEQLVQDFLQFARPRELRPQPVEAVPLVGHVLDLLAAEAQKRGVRIQSQVEPASILGEVDRLHQILMNLCLNALQATPAGGSITLRARPEGREVLLVVEDTGPGIPAGARSHIFEPFFSTKASGTGLGLPIVHAIVQQHGGSISFADRDGGGTRFELRLPAAR